MRCSKCATENPAGKKFCGGCGSALSARCPQCGAENTPSFKFCGDCGASLSDRVSLPSDEGSASASSSVHVAADASEALDGERKTVTALFADIQGSTELIRELDPEEARALIDPVLQLMMEAVHRYDGYVAQSTGDGIFALFGAPMAHEDHPQRALHAALAMQQTIREYAATHVVEGHRAIATRVGVSTGEVVVRTIETGGHNEYTPIGLTAHLAARLQTVAPPGSVAVSETIRQLCEGYFSFRGLGPTAIKGIGQPVEVYEVTGVGTLRTHFELAAQRGLTRFIGRERELAELKRALELARSGHGQIVAAVAEAGTGKSRLVYEFKAALPGDCKVLEAYSVSTGKAAAYQPVLELLHNYFGIEATDDFAARRRKIIARLAALDPTLDDISPYLFALLGIQDTPDPLAQLDPSIKRRRTLEALKRIVLRESVNQPLVVILEDLHWIDTQTQALLDLLADSIANARVLLLVNYRPEYRHQWTGKSYYTQLGLGPLGQDGAEELLAALVGDAAELGPLKLLVADKSGGNPFFIEELIQGFFDEGVLTRNGGVRMTRPLGQVRIPPTVQGILGSRIDRLPSEEKGVLQTLAVIGKDIPPNLVRHVTPLPEGELSRICSDLQAGEFIYERPSSEEAAYTFKHALTQEVAYNSVLLERRRVLHERVGNAIEALHPARLDNHLAELAHHYGRSANLRKAVHYLGRAGNQALERAAYTEAQALLSRGLKLLKELPDDTERAREEISLQTALGWSLFATGGPGGPEREATVVRARELCERLGDEAGLIEALTNLANIRINRLELQSARELAEQALALTAQVDDPGLVARVHYPLGHALYFLGELAASREHSERAVELFGPAPYRNFGEAECARWSALFSTLALALSGYPHMALKRSLEVLSAARRSGDPASIGLTLFADAELSRSLGDLGNVLERAEELLALGAEHDMPLLMLFGSCSRGWAFAAQGQVAQGIAELHRARQAMAASPLILLYVLFVLAESDLWARRPEEGLDVVAEGLALARRTGAELYETGLCNLKGELLLLQGASNAAEAEDCFRQAIQIAQGQSNKLGELYATMSLARLLATQRRRDEARAMLTEIYGWFSEGFDTPVLKLAKGQLDELSA
jgi:class 3 adenylate cyclase/tetratricopeptide (TPR) repeat protein